MFQFKYNVLALIQVLLGALNYFLFIRIFGVSQVSDAYLLTISIIAALNMLQLMLVEQFLVFYNELKEIKLESAYSFYQTNILLTLVVGGFFGGGAILFGESIAKLFVMNLDHSRFELILGFLHIAILELIFSPLLILNQRLFNAEMKFSVSYLLAIIPLFSLLVGTLYIYITDENNIEILLYSKVIGVYISVFISFVIVKAIQIPIGIKFNHPMLIKFIRNSFSMRLGHNLHNLLFTPITSNLLSLLPTGYASNFFYAHRLVGIIHTVVVGPSFNVLQSKLSELWVGGNYAEIRRHMKHFDKITLIVYISIMLISFYLLPYILSLVGTDLVEKNITTIQYLFIGLMLWNLFIVAESSNVVLLIVTKNSYAFILTNSVFSLMYFTFSIIFIEQYGVYTIPVILICGQLLNFFVYSHIGNKVLGAKLVS